MTSKILVYDGSFDVSDMEVPGRLVWEMGDDGALDGIWKTELEVGTCGFCAFDLAEM